MAEASIQAYFYVISAAILLGFTLFSLRNLSLPKKKSPTIKYKIEHPIRFIAGVTAIGVAIMLFAGGNAILEYSDLLKQDIELRDYSIPKKSKIDFPDFEPLRSWMKEAKITSTDDSPLEVGSTKRFQIIVDSPNPPKELIVHFFHEDMKDFFTNEDDLSGFRQLSKQLNRIPTLKYGSIFHIEFNMTKYWECADHTKSFKDECNQLLQIKDVGTFTQPGEYLVQFSAKIDDYEFDHRQSPGTLTDIPDPKETKLENLIIDLKVSAELQRADTKTALGWVYVGIGVGMLFSGISLILPLNAYKVTRNEN